MKEDEQIQTTYTVAQNVLYRLRCTRECCASLLYLGAAIILLNVAIPVLTTYLPKAVITCFIDNRSFAELSMTVLVLMSGVAVLSAASEFLKKYFYFHKYKMNTYYMKCVSEKDCPQIIVIRKTSGSASCRQKVLRAAMAMRRHLQAFMRH